jgi:hypothetical protein
MGPGYAFFRRWRRQGLDVEFHNRLRGEVRVSEGRAAEPTAGFIDSKSVRAAGSVPVDPQLKTVRRLIESADDGPAQRSSRSPASCARTAACTRLALPVRVRIRLMCALTVPALRYS